MLIYACAADVDQLPADDVPFTWWEAEENPACPVCGGPMVVADPVIKIWNEPSGN